MFVSVFAPCARGGRARLRVASNDAWAGHADRGETGGTRRRRTGRGRRRKTSGGGAGQTLRGSAYALGRSRFPRGVATLRCARPDGVDAATGVRRSAGRG